MYFNRRKRVIIITKFQIELRFIRTDHMTSKRHNAKRYYSYSNLLLTSDVTQMSQNVASIGYPSTKGMQKNTKVYFCSNLALPFSKYEHGQKKTQCRTKLTWSVICLFQINSGKNPDAKITCTWHKKFPFALWCFSVNEQQLSRQVKLSKSWRNQLKLIGNQSNHGKPKKRWKLPTNTTTKII